MSDSDYDPNSSGEEWSGAEDSDDDDHGVALAPAVPVSALGGAAGIGRGNRCSAMLEGFFGFADVDFVAFDDGSPSLLQAPGRADYGCGACIR